jgi:hypothetical protein
VWRASRTMKSGRQSLSRGGIEGAMRRLPSLFSAVLLLWSAHALAQGSGGIPPGTFGSGEAKSRPDTVKEDLIGTPRDIRTVPRAPTLPDLTHRAPELSGEHTIASVTPRVSTTTSNRDESRLTSHLFHFDFETPIVPWLYGGAEWGFAAARAPNNDASKFVPGQPQLFARAVHSFQHERYSVGAGLGVLPPVFAYDDKDDRARLEGATASSLVSVVRPWDLSTFLDRRLTTRPWIDLRVSFRRVVVQLRQGLDINYRTSAAPCSTGACDQSGDVQLMSATTLYLGWQPTRELALGLEAWEIFLLKTRQSIADRDRSVLAVSPSVRFFYRWVEPAVSVLFPIGSPLMNAADGYFALRLDMRVWFGGK